MKKGRYHFIVIEGGDGSGKGTQAELLNEYFKSKGESVLKVSFPRYDKPSGYYVGRYLDGAYGGVTEVHPDLASLAYALDRFSAKDEIMGQLAKKDGIVVCDRYVASNMAHQGAKISDPDERRQFYERDMKTEYEIFGIPKPDINIVLNVTTDIAQGNVDKKAARSYTSKKRDIHEADASHLDKAKANYKEICQLYPKEYTAIECVKNGAMRSVEDIRQEILNVLGL